MRRLGNPATYTLLMPASATRCSPCRRLRRTRLRHIGITIHNENTPTPLLEGLGQEKSAPIRAPNQMPDALAQSSISPLSIRFL